MGSGSIFTWIVLALIVYGIVRLMTGNKGTPNHCMTCGTDGPSVSQTRGSMAIEIVLWLCFIVPGLIYSLWRLTTRRPVCGTCGSATLVPFDAPAAAAHRREMAAK